MGRREDSITKTEEQTEREERFNMMLGICLIYLALGVMVLIAVIFE
jgi:uncharacterized membrane protein YqjE